MVAEIRGAFFGQKELGGIGVVAPIIVKCAEKLDAGFGGKQEVGVAFDDLVEIVVGTDGQTGGEDGVVHVVDGIFGTQLAPVLVVFGVENMLGERIGVIFGGVHF